MSFELNGTGTNIMSQLIKENLPKVSKASGLNDSLSDSVTFKYRSQVISMNLKKKRSGIRSSNVSSSSSNQNFLVKYVSTIYTIWTCVKWTYEHSKMEVCVKLIKLISLAGLGLQLRNTLFRHPKTKNKKTKKPKKMRLILKDWGQSSCSEDIGHGSWFAD